MLSILLFEVLAMERERLKRSTDKSLTYFKTGKKILKCSENLYTELF